MSDRCLPDRQNYAELSHFDKNFKQSGSVKVHFFVYIQLHIKTVLFQAIQFSISMQFKHTVKCKNSSF